jgi:hypothetical protein
MCRTATPIDKQVPCSRCGEVANPDDGWENGWPLAGEISAGFPSQLYRYLVPGASWNSGRDDRAFKLAKQHPAIKELGMQNVVFRWGERMPYRLCYECQQRLLQVIGDFFFFVRMQPKPASALEARPQ